MQITQIFKLLLTKKHFKDITVILDVKTSHILELNTNLMKISQISYNYPFLLNFKFWISLCFFSIYFRYLFTIFLLLFIYPLTFFKLNHRVSQNTGNIKDDIISSIFDGLLHSFENLWMRFEHKNLQRKQRNYHKTKETKMGGEIKKQNHMSIK